METKHGMVREQDVDKQVLVGPTDQIVLDCIALYTQNDLSLKNNKRGRWQREKEGGREGRQTWNTDQHCCPFWARPALSLTVDRVKPVTGGTCACLDEKNLVEV